MDRINLTSYIFTNPQGVEIQYEVFFDHADCKQKCEGGIIRNGVDYAGFWSFNGVVTDYDGAFELSPRALKALEQAGFNVEDVR